MFHIQRMRPASAITVPKRVVVDFKILGVFDWKYLAVDGAIGGDRRGRNMARLKAGRAHRAVGGADHERRPELLKQGLLLLIRQSIVVSVERNLRDGDRA